MNNYNQLTPAELERLAILSEECGEVVYIVGKILRHGYASYNPVTGSPVNREILNKEIGDLLNIIDMMIASNDLDAVDIGEYQADKAATISKYLHHQ